MGDPWITIEHADGVAEIHINQRRELVQHTLRPLDEIVSLATRLCSADLHTLATREVAAIVDELIAGYRPVGFSTDCDEIWYRGRICDSGQGFGNLREVIYPPVTREFGRAHIPGRRVFYASWNKMTVLDEISAKTGQHVQLVAVRAREGVSAPCSSFGELTHLYRTGRIRLPAPQLQRAIEMDFLRCDEDMQRRLLYLDAFISDEFRKICPTPIEYQLTAAIAEVFHESASGVMYPSVQTHGAQNLAVAAELFDASFEVLGTELHKVEKSYGYGVFDAKEVAHSCDFEADGRINWNSNKRCQFVPHPMSGNLMPEPGYMGWRSAEGKSERMATKKKKISKSELIERMKASQVGTWTKFDMSELDREAREVVYLMQPETYLQHELPKLGDSEAVKHAVDILSAQLEVILKKRGSTAQKFGPFTNRINLAVKLNPPVDPGTIARLRELNNIYVHFHDGTLRNLADDEETVVKYMDRLMDPPPPGLAMSLRERVELGIRAVAIELDEAGGNSRP